jgi:microsomal dipeptidase-like Zn-dependent dipeptidase
MQSHGPSVAKVVQAIDAIGPEIVVLSTDYGWSNELPRPAAGLLSYVDALWDAGAKEQQLRRMVCENPARLLRLAT